MEKPTVFFSHSSRDKAFLQLLKAKLLSITNNTIEIFLSSDGESIDFGKNWLNKVEQGLVDAKIMFSFVSENSKKSNWLYFESGFAYSKKIKVIPVGICGVNLEMIPAPLSILQGFNITSFEGLNNIIVILNREYSCTYKESFISEDYTQLIDVTDSKGVIISKSKYIDFIQMEIHSNLEYNPPKSDVFNSIKALLSEKKIKHGPLHEDFIYLIGMSFRKIHIANTEDYRIEALIALDNFEENFSILNSFFDKLYKNPVDECEFNICFENGFDIISTDFKLSSQLSNIGVSISEIHGNMYKYGNFLFCVSEKQIEKISNRKHIRIIYTPDKFDLNSVYELLEKLVQAKIVFSYRQVVW